jgi:GT2 family glycosyltransferase
MIDISVIIVTWNSADDILNCINSVTAASAGLTCELLIIDNNSSDNTLELINKISYPDIQTIQNPENLGYTKAVNQGISLSGGKYVLLLNPDTVVNETCLQQLYKFLNENPGYGASAPRMLNEDGSTQHSVRNFPTYWRMFCEFSLMAYIFPKSKLFGSWKMKYMDYSMDSDIPQPMAAGLLIRKDVLSKTGNMDERFEMFFNDVDLCRNIHDEGFPIRLLSSATIIHKHGASVKKDRSRMIKIWNRDCLKYFEKHHNNPLLLLWLRINLKIAGMMRIFYFNLLQ